MNLDSIPGELDAIKRRLDKGDERMQKIETALAENTEVTKEVRDLMIAGKFLRRLIVWWTPIGIFIGGVLLWIREHPKG